MIFMIFGGIRFHLQDSQVHGDARIHKGRRRLENHFQAVK
jgi:hypothetical protein